MLGTYIRRYYGSRYYGKARLLTAAYDAALSEYDLLMMPTTPIKATKLPPPMLRGKFRSRGRWT
jgi:amidase